MNRFVISGEVISLDALRYTPAGMPLLNVKLGHRSEQIEAGTKRLVRCEVPLILAGELAEAANSFKTGDKIKVHGFLDRKSQNNSQLIMHGTKIETSK